MHFILGTYRIIFYEEGGSVDFHFGLQDIFLSLLLDPLKKRNPPNPRDVPPFGSLKKM